MRCIHPSQRQRRCCGGRVVKTFRRPPTGRIRDRNGGLPRLSARSVRRGGAGHRKACATPSENLGKPSLWVMISAPCITPGRDITPRPGPRRKRDPTLRRHGESNGAGNPRAVRTIHTIWIEFYTIFIIIIFTFYRILHSFVTIYIMFYINTC